MEIQLTDGQQAALDMITAWVEDPDSPRFAVFMGYAGTGKTTVLNKILQTLKESGLGQRTAFVAYTNKATNVLAKMSREWGLNIPCMTLAKILGLRPKVVDQETGKLAFIPEYGENPTFNDYQLIVVDETSMVGAELFKHIEQAVHDSDLFHRTKVLFVGDPAQLPPVGERKSPTFEISDVPSVELTEVVRYDGAIAVLAQDVRLNPRRAKFPVIETDHNEDKTKGIFAYDTAEWERQIIRAFTSDKAKADPDYVRVLAYRNKRVIQINNLIKRAVHGDNCPEFFYGQRLIAQDPIMQGDSVMIPTSAEFIVDDAVETEIRCRGEMWPGWKLFTRFDGELCPIRVLKPESQSRYNAALAKLKREKRWDQFWELIYFWHNVRDCYALTVHKSQGSTFENVFLDVRDLTACDTAWERNKLLYTAATRPSKRLFVRQ